MVQLVKDIARKLLNFLHLDLTKNLQYDRLTRKLIRKIVKPGSLCIDVGCHRGEILDLFLKYAPGQKHLAFEPIPGLYRELLMKYGEQCRIFHKALGSSKTSATFRHVVNAPAYSGLREREYAIENPEIEEITVEVETLDAIAAPFGKTDLIKIDVEGGEFDVLLGAENLLREHQPYIIFECGLGASDHYGTDPGRLYQYLTTLGFSLKTLPGFFRAGAPLSSAGFQQVYQGKKEYYFVAYPTQRP